MADGRVDELEQLSDQEQRALGAIVQELRPLSQPERLRVLAVARIGAQRPDFDELLDTVTRLVDLITPGRS